jgi:hypothetical protein
MIGPEKVYHAGESWAEVPGDHHVVSANASDTQPARLLAVFVVDTDEKNLITPDKSETQNCACNRDEFDRHKFITATESNS